MPPNLPNLKPGDVVAGRFRVVEMIGSGGFSVVYRAHQEEVNRFVALKVLKPTASHDDKIVERFRREALFASHLTHPNTITLFDYGTTADLCYIAMEYLEGMDLAAAVHRGEAMDLKRVWKIMVQASRSLAEAHRLGLVHRDLKPENIFLCQRPEGEFVKVLDFGVSKAISSFGDAGPATLAPLTQEGTVFGTPLYMAPEQAMAESITPAVDVYAMGHICYEMITGHAAYEGSNNAMDVMLRQINDPPLALPKPLADTPFNLLITRCTQKDPAHRIANASELLDALMHSDFDPYMDPAERPQTTSTLPRISTLGDTEPRRRNADIINAYPAEFALLNQSLAEVREAGVVRLVVLRGKPGSGRSDLLRAFLAHVYRDPDLLVMHRTATDSLDSGLESELSLLTGQPLHGDGVDEVRRILRTLYGEEIDLAHTVAELGTDSNPLNSLASTRESMLHRIAQPFRDRSNTAPIVWGLENIERLDTLTLAFLDRFFRDLQTHPAPVMIVATVYPEDLRRRPGLVRYTQGLLQASEEFAKQLSIVPAGLDAADLGDGTSEGEDFAAFEGEAVSADPATEEIHVDAAADRDPTPALSAESAFDHVLGYLAQLGDDVPEDLWKLVVARILTTELVGLTDSILSQADKFGIIQRSNDVIRFTKAGFAEMLRQSFESSPDASTSHRALGALMQQYYVKPTHENIKAIALQYRLGDRPVAAIRLLYDAGEASYQAIDLDAAREYFLRIQKILETAPDLHAEPGGLPFQPEMIWLRLGEIHGALNEFGAAEDALKRALNESDPGREVIGRANKLLGDLAASQERYNDALRHYEIGRVAFRELDQPRPFVAITGEMGQCALMQGRPSLAEELTLQALQMASQLLDDALVARVHRQMGQVLTRRARFEEGANYLAHSLRLFESIGREHDVVACLTELGRAKFAVGAFTEAQHLFQRGIQLTSTSRFRTTYDLHLGLAQAYAAARELDAAEQHLLAAHTHANTAQDLNRTAEVHLYRGDLALARGSHLMAIDHYETTIELARSIGLTRFWLIALVRLAYVELDRGNEPAIYERLGEALQQSRALHDTESDLTIRAHIIYTQLLTHGFRAKGDTFSSLLMTSADQQMHRAAALCYMFKADVSASRGAYQEARELLRAARVSAAQLGEYAFFLPITRRNALLDTATPLTTDGFALGTLIPPEVGVRRFKSLPKTI